MKKFFVALIGVLSTFYILNPTAGIFELIPDNFPVIGNLDEAAATALLITCLAYFGMDITKLFKREKKKEEVQGKVIDVDPRE